MSTNDPIEDMFRDNQHGLDEKPRDLIWDRIEERLDEKSVQKKKIQWWKYATAASVVVGMMIGIWALLNNPEPVSQMESAPMVYETPEEINKENASEILDKLEENNQSVVIRDEKKSAPKIIESELENKPQQIELKLPEPMKSEAVYDIAPMEEISAAPVIARAKISEEGEKIGVQSKKESKAISQNPSQTELSVREDTRRLGNMDKSEVFYEKTPSDSTIVNQFYVKTSTSDLKYKQISKKNDSLIYSNSTIKYPSEIIFIQTIKAIKVEFKGDKNYKNSQESKEIQKYVNENKEWIFNQIAID